jgi:hypothetical protein
VHTLYGITVLPALLPDDRSTFLEVFQESAEILIVVGGGNFQVVGELLESESPAWLLGEECQDVFLVVCDGCLRWWYKLFKRKSDKRVSPS